MEEWKEYRLGEFMLFNPKEKIAKGAVSRKIAMDQLVPFCRDVDSQVYEEYKGGAKFKNGDTIMARITPCLENGKTSYISSLEDDEVAFGSTEYIVLRNIEGVSDTRFVYYLSICPEIRGVAIKSMVGSSGRQRVQQDVLENYCVSLPSLPTQQKIANILSSLDDKIEVNRRINAELEELAQALFKSWFVDFEPFKDSEFVESELGMIPKGWKVGSISEICDVLSGFAFKSSSFVDKGNYRLITIKGVQDGYLETNGAAYINEVPSKMPSYCSLNIGDILLSLTGNVGRCCYVSYEDLLLNQRVAKLYPKNSLDVSFVYTFFRKQDTKTLLELMARGTAQANLSPIETSKMKVVLPERKVLDDFGCICNPLFWKMIHNQQEILHLTALRDTLLPKLMSGEIDVNEVEL